jgi:hypothetical protein
LREALETDDAFHVMNALCAEAIMFATQGGPRNARKTVRAVERLRAVAGRAQTPYARALVHLAESRRLLHCHRRYADALAEADRAEELLAREARPLPWERVTAGIIQTVALTYNVDLARQSELVRKAEAEANEHDVRQLPITVGCNDVLHHLTADRLDLAFALLDRRRAHLHLSDYFRFSWMCVMNLALRYDRRAAHAFELYEQAHARLRRTSLYRSEAIRFHSELYRAGSALAAYYETGDRGLRKFARRRIHAMPDDGTFYGGARCAFAASLCHADGDTDAALRLMHEAAQRYRASQTELFAVKAERCMNAFAGHTAKVGELDETLRQAGVTNPQRLIAIYIPTA